MKQDNSDWYEIVVPAASSGIDVALLHRIPVNNDPMEPGTSDGEDLNLALQMPGGTVLTAVDTKTNHELISISGVAAGTHYLVIGGPNNTDALGGTAYFIGWSNALAVYKDGFEGP